MLKNNSGWSMEILFVHFICFQYDLSLAAADFSYILKHKYTETSKLHALAVIGVERSD